jgi:hypothetical protein
MTPDLAHLLQALARNRSRSEALERRAFMIESLTLPAGSSPATQPEPGGPVCCVPRSFFACDSSSP